MTDSDQETLDHESNLDLYAVILGAQRGATEDVVHAISEASVSLTQLKLLHILARPHRRPPRISRVGELLAIDQSHAARVVRGLEREDLAHNIDDEDDRRVRRVVITEKGRELVVQLDRRRIRELSAFRRTLTADQRRLLDKATAAIVRRPELAALRPAEEAKQ